MRTEHPTITNFHKTFHNPNMHNNFHILKNSSAKPSTYEKKTGCPIHEQPHRQRDRVPHLRREAAKVGSTLPQAEAKSEGRSDQILTISTDTTNPSSRAGMSLLRGSAAKVGNRETGVPGQLAGVGNRGSHGWKARSSLRGCENLKQVRNGSA
jgi:hypothetical protein